MGEFFSFADKIVPFLKLNRSSQKRDKNESGNAKSPFSSWIFLDIFQHLSQKSRKCSQAFKKTFLDIPKIGQNSDKFWKVLISMLEQNIEFHSEF